MHSRLLTPYDTSADLGFMRDIGIIAGIFDHTAAALMRGIGA
jgi:hypothetical protein